MPVRRYPVAWSFLACFLAMTIARALLPPHEASAVARWASTSVANMEQHPVGSLVVSAVVASGSAWAWPVLIALAMFGAERAAGHLRTVVVCAAGHVIGTLVSEGIVAYRVHAGLLPAADRHLLDVGPSYVVLSAIVLAMAFGSRRARAAAVADLAILVFAGHIVSGLGRLDVAAVGHVTAMAVAGYAALLIATVWPPAQPPVEPPAGPPARDAAGLA